MLPCTPSETLIGPHFFPAGTRSEGMPSLQLMYLGRKVDLRPRSEALDRTTYNDDS